MVIATASTRNPDFIGGSLINRDLTFLPIRESTPTPVAPGVTKGQTAVPAGEATSQPFTGTLTSQADTGWLVYDRPSEGFGVALPPSWWVLDDQARQEIMDQIPDLSPELAQVFTDALRNAAGSGVKLMAFDVDLGRLSDGYPSGMTVTKARSSGFSLNTIVQMLAKQTESFPGVQKPVTHSRVTVAAGPAELFEYRMTLTVQSRQLEIQVRQYIWVRGSAMYGLALVCSQAKAEQYRDDFAKIVDSFGFIE